MKSETLEKLKKEAANALSRHLCTLGVGSAQEALAMMQVLAALNGMTADEPSDVAKDVRRAYEAALLNGTGAYTMKYDAACNGIGVVTAPLTPKPCPVLGCTYSAGHNAPHNNESGCACPDTWHGQVWHSMECRLREQKQRASDAREQVGSLLGYGVGACVGCHICKAQAMKGGG